MKEDPLLTPRPWWSWRRGEYRSYTAPRRSWAGGLAFLTLVALAVPTLVFALSRL